MDLDDLDLSRLPPRGRERLFALANEIENLRAAVHRKGDLLSDFNMDLRKLEARAAALDRDHFRPVPLNVTGHVSIAGQSAEIAPPGGVVDPAELVARDLGELRERVKRLTAEREAIVTRLQPAARLLTRALDELARRGFTKNNRHLPGGGPRGEVRA